MGESESRDGSAVTNTPMPQEMPVTLAQLLAAARTSPGTTMEQALASVQQAQSALESRTGTEYLLFTCANIPCAAPLTALREVLRPIPRVVPLPFSPHWLLGIFPLHSDMLGLVDPVPMLIAGPGKAAAFRRLPQLESPRPAGALDRNGTPPIAGSAPTDAIVVGNGEHALAWSVGSVGDIALVQDDEIDTGPGPTTFAGLPFIDRYIASIYTPASTDQRYLILRAERLLNDLLHALEESDKIYG